jgi:predicted DCC family thiol-disulfide oxidoreductase YuxK
MTIMRPELRLKRAIEQAQQQETDVIVIYDGQCVFCNSYVKLMRLRASAGRVLLLDARQKNVARQVKEALGLDLDEGMLVLYGNQSYYGSEAMHILSSLTSASNAWNALMAGLFKTHWLARRIYPVFKAGRRLMLFFLGRPKIQSSE